MLFWHYGYTKLGTLVPKSPNWIVRIPNWEGLKFETPKWRTKILLVISKTIKMNKNKKIIQKQRKFSFVKINRNLCIKIGQFCGGIRFLTLEGFRNTFMQIDHTWSVFLKSLKSRNNLIWVHQKIRAMNQQQIYISFFLSTSIFGLLARISSTRMSSCSVMTGCGM